MIQVVQAPTIFSFNPAIQNKYNTFGSNELKSIIVGLESKKNKNFTIDYNSLLAGSDLKSAEEYNTKINYGVKSIGGGVMSLQMHNQKLFQQKEQQFLNLNYSLQSPSTIVNFSFKNLNNTTTNYKGQDTTLMEFQFRSKF